MFEQLAPGLWSETPKTGFLESRLIFYGSESKIVHVRRFCLQFRYLNVIILAPTRKDVFRTMAAALHKPI